jgi:response regulator RpfG family c-di-GMP phosphodiesterase
MAKRSQTSNNTLKIVIFDDSDSAEYTYRAIFERCSVSLSFFKSCVLDPATKAQLREINPHLLIVDLMFGSDRLEGYGLIKDISKTRGLEEAPVIICSKCINDSPHGRRENARCIQIPCVRATYSKFPCYPTCDELLTHARKLSS